MEDSHPLHQPSANQWPGWVKPGSEQAGGARHIILIYTTVNPARPSNAGVDKFLPYVTYLDKDLTPRDTMFDTFLFLPVVSNPGGCRYDSGGDKPSNLQDWRIYLDQIFHPDYQLAGLDKTVLAAQEAIGKPERVRVMIAIPYPSPKQSNFGDPYSEGRSLDFTDSEKGLDDRRLAVHWYIEEVLRRWQEAELAQLDLIGFYWFEEEVHAGEEPVIQAAAQEVHEKGFGYYWIPWFHSPGYERWKELGFDLAMMQPNLSFNKLDPDEYGARMKVSAEDTQRLGMGMEMELGEPLSREEVRQKYLAYLEWGEKLGYREGAVLSYYQAIGLFGAAARSDKPEWRALYDLTYRFIKG